METYQSIEPAFSISIPKEMIAMGTMTEDLIIPVLMAAGYGDETIARAFAEQDVV